jgi:inhibitor of KinA sporulation pathway (predicted exonuclease)
VRPEKSHVSPFCTSLTTLTQADVDAGVTRDRVFASYGDYDRRQFERQCTTRGIPYPFGPTHLNVKNLFALERRLDREVGMDGALRMLGLPLEGTHHRGGDDAWNIAAILAQLLGLPEKAP